MNDPLAALGQQGVEALQRGDAATARAAFDQIEAAGRGTHQLRLLLAQACTMLGDAPAAHRTLDRVLADEPTNLYALLMRADLIAAAGNDRAAVSWYQAALAQAPRAGALPPDLVTALKKAEQAVARSSAAFESHVQAALAEAAVATSPSRRFAEAMDLLAGRAEVQLQRPTSFYYPQLPQRPFFEREEFAWAAALEAAAPVIRSELEAVLSDEAALAPYVTGEPDRPVKQHPLLEDPRWSAFHLYRQGAPTERARILCPATLSALAAAPLPAIDGRAPMALFSVLRAGTHIPPHNGMLNTRLLCHLPLIVPPNCRLRVGNETRTVEAGRLMIFDDTIEHEAWNDSAETRIVLIFEIWRPELDAAERTALTALFGAIGAYGTDVA